jgi:hypothetical protein
MILIATALVPIVRVQLLPLLRNLKMSQLLLQNLKRTHQILLQNPKKTTRIVVLARIPKKVMMIWVLVLNLNPNRKKRKVAVVAVVAVAAVEVVAVEAMTMMT